jgi:hypothetical protein
MASNQIGQTNANTTAQQNEQGILQGANSANNSIQGSLAGIDMQGQQSLIGGLMNTGGAGAGMAKAAGGVIHGYDAGGPVSAFTGNSMFAQSLAPQSAAPGMSSTPDSGAAALQKGASSLFHKQQAPQSPQTAQAHGGKVPAVVSPGEGYLKPTAAQMAAKGKVNPLKAAEVIPGQAKVKGDSYANDTVRKDLDEGGVVIPRSIMNSKNPEKSAAEFVRAALAKRKKA